MTETWPWFAVAGLGALHGLNPAMGWLFAVALGLHRQSRSVVMPLARAHRRRAMPSRSWPSPACWSARRLPGGAAGLCGHRHRDAADRLGPLSLVLRPSPPGSLWHAGGISRPGRLVVPDGNGARRRPDALASADAVVPAGRRGRCRWPRCRNPRRGRHSHLGDGGDDRRGSGYRVRMAGAGPSCAGPG